MRISDWSSDVCSSDLHWKLDKRLSEAVAAPRTHFAGGSDTLVAEPAVPPEARRRLEAIGYRLGERDRQSVVEGKRVAVRVDLGGWRHNKKTKQKEIAYEYA